MVGSLEQRQNAIRINSSNKNVDEERDTEDKTDPSQEADQRDKRAPAKTR